MSGTIVSINQGTQIGIANDSVGGTMYQTVKIDIGTAGASSLFTGTIPQITNLAGGTVVVSSGSINVGTISTLIDNLDGGTLNVLQSGTINSATVVLNNGTIDLLKSGTITKIEGGSIVVTNGTMVSNGGSVQISDNTNIVNIANLGTGSNSTSRQNGLISTGGFYEYSSTISSQDGDLLPATDVGNFRGISLNVVGTYTGTVTFQGCNDNSSFKSIQFYNSDTTTGGPQTTLTNLTGTSLLFGNTYYRYLRIRMTGYTSGTAKSYTELYSYPTVYQSFSVNSSQSGNWNTGTVSMLSAGTISMINAGTLTSLGSVTGMGSVSNVGSIGVLNAGTITTLSNLTNGSIKVTAGTEVITSGTISMVSAGTISMLNAGTLTSSGTTTGVGTLSNVGSVYALLHGTIDAGTVKYDGRVGRNILTYGTTFAGTAAGYATLVGSAAVGAGTSTWINNISVVNPNSNIVCLVGFGTALNGTSVLLKGTFGTTSGIGIEKDYPLPVNAGMTNQDLVAYMSGAGTIDVNISYFISA